MKIFSIQNYKIPGGIKTLNNSINSLNRKADRLMTTKTYVTRLLPNSTQNNSNHTRLTIPQMVDIVLKNIT